MPRFYKRDDYEIIHADTGEVLQDHVGREVPDPTPMAPPVGYFRQPSLFEIQRQQLRAAAELLRQEQEGAETFEEADDFDVGDDYEPESPYELREFDGPPEPSPSPEAPPAEPVEKPAPTGKKGAPASAPDAEEPSA